jgi:hypothetical protein
MKTILKTILKTTIQTLFGLALGAFFVLMLVEWAAGCGESYVDSKGITHVNECVFINKLQGVSKP